MSEKQPPNIAQARAEIGNMQRAFRAFAEADHALQALESIEQTTREIHAAHEKAATDYEAAQAELAKVQQAIADGKAEDAAARKKAMEQRDRMIAKAQEEAAHILAKAEEKAAADAKVAYDTAIENATKDAAALVATAEARLAELKPLLDKAERLAAAMSETTAEGA